METRLLELDPIPGEVTLSNFCATHAAMGYFFRGLFTFDVEKKSSL